MRHISLLLQLSLTCTLGCSHNNAKAGGWEGTIDTLPSGIVRVTNPSQGLGTVNDWRIREDLRLGSVDGGPEEFHGIWDLAVDAQGRIFVLLARIQEIRVFDAAGRYVRTIGQSGSGPGEFRAPSQLMLRPDGNLIVVDDGNARYSVFDSSGALVTEHPRRLTGRCRPTPCGGITRNGTVFDGDAYFVDRSEFRQRFIKLNDMFQALDTISLPPHPASTYTGGLYSPRPQFALGPDGFVWFGLNNAYRMYKVDARGDTLRIVEREAKPVRISQEDLEQGAEIRRAFAERVGSSPRLRETDTPTYKPLYHQFTVDNRGFLWVIPPGTDDGSASALDVFDAEGRYLGSVEVDFPISVDRMAVPPLDPSPLLIVDNHLYAVSHDASNIPYVIRGRISGR